MVSLMEATQSRDYREIIEKTIGYASNRRPRGSIQRLAEAANCHPTYIAQVLRGERDLSLEQGISVAESLNFSDELKEFFLLLVQLSRAGTESLRAYFVKKIDQFIQQAFDLSPRELALRGGLDSQYEAEYFGDYRYQILHAYCLKEQGATTAWLSEKVPLMVNDIEFILGRLERMGLLELRGDRWISSQNFLHLSKSSPFIRKLHETWLSKALSDVQQSSPHDTRYSGIVLLSEEDLGLVREEMVKLIGKVRSIATKSSAKKMSILCLHHYELP